MTTKLKAVFFDFDGVLRDSVAQQWTSYRHALATHGLESVSDEQLRQHAHHIKYVHSNLAGHVSDKEFIGAFYEKLEELRPTIGMYDGTKQLLEILNDRGYKVALVTSATKTQAPLAVHGLTELFETIIDGNDTTEHKPHPEPMFRTLEVLELDARDAIMIGDMASDILSAQAAGLRATIGITHGMGTKETLLAAGASYIVNSLQEVVDTIEEIEHGS